MLIILFVGASGYIHHQKQSNQQNISNDHSRILTVDAIQAKHFTIFDEIEALGTTFANEAVEITANTTDIITQIMFTDSMNVSKGDILAILQQEEELAQKQVILAQKDENERELKRLSNLLKNNATAKNEYDQRKTLLRISESRLEEVNARINDKTIRAPFDGIVGLRKISIGSLVEPGTVITTLDDISKIKLDFSIPERYLDVVQQGLNIKAHSDALNILFEGTITNIDSRVDATTRSVEVRAILPNDNRKLKPGMLLSIKLLRNERKSIVVPEEAITSIQSRHFAYLIDENKVIKKEIKIGQRKSGWVEILDGIEADDIVMTHGQIRVRPGESVKYKINNMTLNLGA